MIYPNPTNNQLTMISEKSSINSILINDVQGRIVAGMTKNQTLGSNDTFSTTIDISSIASGIYLINIKTEDQSIVTKKIVKL